MTFNTNSDIISNLLAMTADEVDVPGTMRTAAHEAYRSVGMHLQSQATPTAWDMYAQGSFETNTVVRPIVGSGGFDIDMVCQRDIQRSSVTQADLKQQVGDALTEYVESDDNKRGAKLEEKRRAWTLTYDDDFHLDVLPAIPDDTTPSATSIVLTDHELHHWQSSDPKAYSKWFLARSQTERDLLVKMAAERSNTLAPPPDPARVKTSLQQAVQLLKQHRNHHFVDRDEVDLMTPSILITTLAALAYRQEPSLIDSFCGIVDRMHEHIERTSTGLYLLCSPVSDENFADKWNHYPERREAFERWLEHVKSDVDAWERTENRGLTETFGSLEKSFGFGPIKKVAESYGANAEMLKSTGGLAVVGPLAGLAIATSRTAARPNTFYGQR